MPISHPSPQGLKCSHGLYVFLTSELAYKTVTYLVSDLFLTRRWQKSVTSETPSLPCCSFLGLLRPGCSGCCVVRTLGLHYTEVQTKRAHGQQQKNQGLLPTWTCVNLALEEVDVSNQHNWNNRGALELGAVSWATPGLWFLETWDNSVIQACLIRWLTRSNKASKVIVQE